MDKRVKAFRIISTLEAISFLFLLIIAMPLKYAFDKPELVTIVGYLHGILFVLYVIGALIMTVHLKWSFKILAISILCSVLPFGPFYVERKYLPKSK